MACICGTVLEMVSNTGRDKAVGAFPVGMASKAGPADDTMALPDSRAMSAPLRRRSLARSVAVQGMPTKTTPNISRNSLGPIINGRAMI